MCPLLMLVFVFPTRSSCTHESLALSLSHSLCVFLLAKSNVLVSRFYQLCIFWSVCMSKQMHAC